MFAESVSWFVCSAFYPHPFLFGGQAGMIHAQELLLVLVLDSGREML